MKDVLERKQKDKVGNKKKRKILGRASRTIHPWRTGKRFVQDRARVSRDRTAAELEM